MTENADKIEHDIEAAISALELSLEMCKDSWRNNPQLVEKIVPLSISKMEELLELIQEYHIQWSDQVKK